TADRANPAVDLLGRTVEIDCHRLLGLQPSHTRIYRYFLRFAKGQDGDCFRPGFAALILPLVRRPASHSGAGVAALLAALAISSPEAQTAAAAANKHQPAKVTVEWVGDIALSSQKGLPGGGVAAALAPVRGLLDFGDLRHGDITTGNLEGTLSVGGPSKCG